MSFKVHKDRVSDNSLNNNTSTNTLNAANGDSILSNDILELDGGYLEPNPILVSDELKTLTDQNSGGTVNFVEGNVILALDKNLSDGAFGRVNFIGGTANRTLTFQPGTDGTTNTPRIAIGYLNNNGTNTAVLSSGTIKYTVPASDAQNFSSTLKWRKILDSSIYVECDTAATTTPFTIVP